MKAKELLKGNKKNALIGALMLATLFILLPNFIKVVGWQFAPYTDDELVITTVSYYSPGMPGGEPNVIVGNLYQPAPKFSNKTYPAIIACHGFLLGIGKESMIRWCVEVARRGFVVLSLDLPSAGMTLGEMDMFPRADFEPQVILDGINYLSSLDFVDGTKIGLMGISYGGATVSMAAGVLGERVSATVSMNGFTNTTNWLINGILPMVNAEFTVQEDYIQINKINNVVVTSTNIKEFLRLYGIVRGDESQLSQFIIEGTTRISRTFLKKFDAVEYLPNVKNGSMMFLHSLTDNTFNKTNQSGQGYTAIKNANKISHYISLNDNHQLMADPNFTSDYCIINFFEEKLKGVALGSHASDLAKYSQKRDIILNVSPLITFAIMYESLIIFFMSIILAFLVIAIIFQNKKIAVKRAQKEEAFLLKKKEDKDFIDMSFGRGSYSKTMIFMVLAYFLAFLMIMGMGMGLFSEIIVGTLCAAFYPVLFLMMYYVPDKKEVDLWKKLKGKDSTLPKRSESDDLKLFDMNNFLKLGVILIIVVVGAVIGLFMTFLPSFFLEPIEAIIWPMLGMGSFFLIAGLLLIYLMEKRENDGIGFKNLNWNRYTLDKYQIIKGLAFGSVLYLNFYFQYNIWAFYAKFPMIIGPHSFYFVFVMLAVAVFYGGIQVLLKFFKEKFLKDHINFKFPNAPKKEKGRKALIEAFTLVFGLSLYILIGYIAFTPLLNTTLFGNLTSIVVILLAATYLITNIIKIFCPDRSVLGLSIFFPIWVFTLLSLFLHF